MTDAPDPATARPARPPRRADSLILRGYGPLAGLVAVLLLLTMLVPSRPRSEADAVNVGQASAPLDAGGDAVAGGPAPGQNADAGAAGPAGTQPATGTQAAGTTPGAGSAATKPRPGAGPGAGPGARPGTGTASGPLANPAAGTKAGKANAAGASAATPDGVTRASNCSGGVQQDANTAYSPPCMTFRGANGGATARGVTADTITIAMRDLGSNLGGGNKELEKAAEKKGLISTPEAQKRTRDALLAYFNKTYQLYGRTVKLVSYQGRGDTIKELSGTGQEGANADALKVGQEIKAFADLSALSQPYLDALVRQKVVAFGGLHMPAAYYKSRAPYAWGQLIDCTTLTTSAIDLIVKRYAPSGNAEKAGSASMRTKPRKYGLVVPDDAVYAQCIDDARPRMKAAGIVLTKEIRYSLDFAKMQGQTPNIAAQLKASGVTTVLLVTDPVLPFFLSGSATQQDFWPEWFVTGTFFTDVDVAGQFYDQDQWKYAAGQSYISDIKQGKDSESWRAYHAIRPMDEPTSTRDLDFYPMQMLFIGLQMAGPNLTPETFQRGMFSYGPHAGSLGTWSWGPNDYTAIDDAREIYWDGKALSPFNNQPGRYISPAGGKRYRGAVWPTTEPSRPVAAPSAP